MDFQEELDSKAYKIKYLEGMFGPGISSDNIAAVLESFGGEMEEAIECLLQMSSQSEEVPNENANENNEALLRDTNKNHPSSSKMPSYSALLRTSNPQIAKPFKNPTAQENTSNKSQHNLQAIIDNYHKGYRNLIILRGLPGSGKSYKAKKITEFTAGVEKYNDLVCSADHFFMKGDYYEYDRSQVSHAHKNSQMKASALCQAHLSPVIIDNTNIYKSDLYPYLHTGVSNGYIISILEPDTKWAWSINYLARKNIHNVPQWKIKSMKDNFETIVSVDKLLQEFCLTYPVYQTPPQLRVIHSNEMTKNNTDSTVAAGHIPRFQAVPHNNSAYDEHQPPVDQGTPDLIVFSENETTRNDTSHPPNSQAASELTLVTGNKTVKNDMSYPPEDEAPAAQICFPNNETKAPVDETIPQSNCISDWDKMSLKIGASSSENHKNAPKPQRQTLKRILKKSVLIQTDSYIDSTNSMSNAIKVLNTSPRDINASYVPQLHAIPFKQPFHKGTSTLELENSIKDSEIENYFYELKSMFSQIPEAYLRDIYEKCSGDVAWAVDIIMSGLSEVQLDSAKDLDRDVGNIPTKNIENNHAASSKDESDPLVVIENEMPLSPLVVEEQSEKFNQIMELKKIVERKIVLGNEHYSERLLKVRDSKRGVIAETEDKNAIPTTSQATDETEGLRESCSESDEFVNFNLSGDIVTQLTDLFGGPPIPGASDVIPLISAPKSLLKELHVLWMESLAHQTSMQKEYDNVLKKEEEEYSRLLQQSENNDQQTEPPNLKEIMDLEMALSIYRNETERWRNVLPDNMAYKLTVQKLGKLFPELSESVLTEILAAHDNNFQSTMETLLMSTGQTDALYEENGISKFIFKKELALQKEQLHFEKAKLQTEWPELSPEHTDMDTVACFREQAQAHYAMRKAYLDKASYYYRQKKPDVSSTYAQLAELYSQKFEQCNHLAATTLILVNSRNTANETLDLHSMHVKEALHCLDLFVDFHIQKLRETSYGRNTANLFFITGRGLHSSGGPKIKPAVQKRLTKRGFNVKTMNPGLLAVTITAHDRLTT